MKTTKIIAAATIITLVLIALCGVATAERGEFFPLLTLCIGYEQVEDSDEFIYDCIDKDGNVWSFYGDRGDYRVGDMLNLLMWNCGGAEDAEVIEVYYEGTLTVAEMLNWYNK